MNAADVIAFIYIFTGFIGMLFVAFLKIHDYFLRKKNEP